MCSLKALTVLPIFKVLSKCRSAYTPSQVQVSGGQGLVANAKMEAYPLPLFQVEQVQFGKRWD